jgi:polysaccharide biosynthesis protein PelE
MHTSKPEGHQWPPTGLVAVSLPVEVSFVLYGWHFATDLTEVLLLHAFISLLAGCGGLVLLRRGTLSASMALYVLSVVVLGPIGVFGCALMGLVCWLSSRSATSFEEWYERLFPRVLSDRTQVLYELIEERGAKPSRESTVAPFCEVLDQGSVAQKQSVVALIADHFRPEFAQALQRALNDPEPVIRVQAATAAARIEHTFHQQAVVLQEDSAKKPDNLSIALRIALHHEAYARTGLLDAERAASERKVALDINMRLLQSSPQNAELTAAAARLLLELERPQEAIRLLAPWLRAKPIPHALVSPIADALYSLKRLRLLRRISTRLLANLTTSIADEPLRAALSLWTPTHG